MGALRSYSSFFINDVPEEVQDLDIHLCLYGENSEQEVESTVFCRLGEALDVPGSFTVELSCSTSGYMIGMIYL